MANDIQILRDALRCGNRSCSCRRGTGNVHCPVEAHRDTDPSLALRVGKDRDIVVHCHGGCSQDAVVTALVERGLWGDTVRPALAPLPPIRNAPPARQEGQQAAPTPIEVLRAVYDYRDHAGAIVAQKGRFELPGGKKTFRWRRAGEEAWGGLGGAYTMTDFALWGADLSDDPDAPVYYCEGEKATGACIEHGLLAVCFAGGAGSKDFGAALDALAGRTVRVWPDNDPVGREYAAVVMAKLAGIAASVTLVQPPITLPDHGDAFDYFASGGTVQGIEENLPPASPVVTVESHDAVRVRVPSAMGVVGFSFREMERTARELPSSVTITLEGPGQSRAPYTQRLNLLSLSQRTEMRRELEAIHGHGKDAGWAKLINTAVQLATETFTGQDRSISYADIPDAGPVEWLVDRFIPRGLPTVIFGDGGASKTYLCLAIAVAATMGTPFAGRPTRRIRAAFVDYEDTSATFRRRVGRLLQGHGIDPAAPFDFIYWSARGVPLHDQIDSLRHMVEHKGIDLLIVDAANDACGGDPASPEIAARYFNALAKLPEGVTTITIAHVTKSDDYAATLKPYGSVVWHNRARLTWYVRRAQEAGLDDLDVAVFSRKYNDGGVVRPINLHVKFVGENGPVTYGLEQTWAPELSQQRALADQIWDALDVPRTVAGIADTLRPDLQKGDRARYENTIRTTLHRGLGKRFAVKEGQNKESNTWTRLAHQDAETGHNTAFRTDPRQAQF